MTLKSKSLKLIITFIIVNSFKYRKIISESTQILNFIGGIGIPVEDLHFESVTSGFVLKAEYLLPETADEFQQKFRPQKIHRKRKSINETNIYENGFNRNSILNELKNTGKNINKNFFNLSHNLKLKNEMNHLQHTAEDNLKINQKRGVYFRWSIYKAIETILNKSALNGHICMLRSICEHAAIPLRYEGGLLAEIMHIILTPSASRDVFVNPNHENYIRAEIAGRSGEDCLIAFGQCTESPMETISTVFEI